jgi:hypothetical protein
MLVKAEADERGLHQLVGELAIGEERSEGRMGLFLQA